MSATRSDQCETPLSTGAAIRGQLAATRRRDWVVLFFVFVMFFVAFRWAPHLVLADRLVGTQLRDFHDGFQLDSDGLVIGRLNQNVTHGLFSAALTLGLDGTYPTSLGFYAGQFGLGGWLLTLPSTLIGASGWFGVPLMYALVSAGNALLATAAVSLAARAMSNGAGVLVAIALLQPWPSAMAHSIYWMIGLKVLPAAVLALMMGLGRDTRMRLLCASAGLTLLSAMSGYEFLTVVVALQLGVLAYYAIVRRDNVAQALRLMATAVVGSVAGFVMALSLQILQLWLRLGSLTAAVGVLDSTVSKRTGVTSLGVDAMYGASLSSSPSSVLDAYLAMPVIGSPVALPLVRYLTVTTLLAMCAVVIVVVLGEATTSGQRRREMALGAAWVVTLLGPIGWFLLARPHSFIHQHINFALWYLPTVPLGLALLWGPVRRGFVGMKAQPVLLAIVGATAVALLASYAYSLTSMR